VTRSGRRDHQSLFELAAGAVTLGYGAALNRLLPEVMHLPANSAAATAFMVAARWDGATLEDLGLAPERVWPGARTGLACAAPVVAGVVCAAAIPGPDGSSRIDASSTSATSEPCTRWRSAFRSERRSQRS
jgi:hypothetical protein